MSSRYYDVTGPEEELKPGRISNELRQALNLAENDIPLWIYRMRAMGYPPGWLKKAIVDTSDIFDTDNEPNLESKKRKDAPDDGQEIQYDHSKLIDYPGFNSPMPENSTDYHYYVNMPAMLEHQQLEYAKKHMTLFKPVQLPKKLRTAIVDEKDTSIVEKKEEETKEPEKTMNEEIKLLSKASPLPTRVKRASLESFSEGIVGELLYFENIPNSTGQFGSISKLISDMRKSSGSANNSIRSEKDV